MEPGRRSRPAKAGVPAALEKLAEQSKELGGRVFDVLGDEIFEETSLRDLLIEAVRYGDQPEVQAPGSTRSSTRRSARS